MTYLFLDDERNPGDVNWSALGDPIDYVAHDWIVVRSYGEAVDWIEANGLPAHISFDHDLGDDLAGNGHKVAKFIVNYVIDRAVDGDIKYDMRYSVHSKNPVGAVNILKLLDRFREVCGFKSKLFFDPAHNPTDEELKNFRLPNGFVKEGWEVVRSYEEAVEWVETNGKPEQVSFSYENYRVEGGKFAVYLNERYGRTVDATIHAPPEVDDYSLVRAGASVRRLLGGFDMIPIGEMK